jgi:hypothetical protein
MRRHTARPSCSLRCARVSRPRTTCDRRSPGPRFAWRPAVGRFVGVGTPATSVAIVRFFHSLVTVKDEQKLVCHCSRKSRVVGVFGRALLAGHGLRKIRSRAVQNLLEMNVFSRQAVAHRPVIYRSRLDAALSTATYTCLPNCARFVPGARHRTNKPPSVPLEIR